MRSFTVSERDWLEVRRYLQQHRYELAVKAAGDYPVRSKIAGTPLLGAAEWVPADPIALSHISLTWSAPTADVLTVAACECALSLLPERYRRYSDVMSALDAPAVFENRPTYRLTAADLAATEPVLTFTRGRYFDGIDLGEAAAHEYARVRLSGQRAGLRRWIDDPCDLARRPANLAITTLTLRLDRSAGRASFLLHWRDPAKVGHAGGLYQVVPVGLFQPSGEAAWNEHNDFSLWRCMIREFDEELRGRSEDYRSENGPIEYDTWPFARQLTEELGSGRIRAWCLGLGVDPLTYATDLLTAVVIDSDVFDELFSVYPRSNAEGKVLAAREFGQTEVEHATTREPMQAAGAAALRLAWRERDSLLT